MRVDMRGSKIWGSRLGRLAVLSIAAVALCLSACGASSSKSTASASDSVLPRNFVVPLSVVAEYFPEVIQEASTGGNSTAVGNPKATRSVIYVNGDGSMKVTISADLYRSSSDAASAYKQAYQQSIEVPGFEPISIPKVGQQAFAGTVTMGGETHIGLGALDGALIVGVTLAGYDATPDNIANLVGLARAEDAVAQVALGCL